MDLKCFIKACLRFGPKPSMPSNLDEKEFLTEPDGETQWQSGEPHLESDAGGKIPVNCEATPPLQADFQKQFVGLVLVILLQTCNWYRHA